MKTKIHFPALLAFTGLLLLAAARSAFGAASWSEDELTALCRLWIGSLPPLRNVAERGPYMHAGQFATLQEVLNHYNTAPEAPAEHSELEPLHLSQKQIDQIIAFLKTLDSPVRADPRWLGTPQ